MESLLHSLATIGCSLAYLSAQKSPERKKSSWILKGVCQKSWTTKSSLLNDLAGSRFITPIWSHNMSETVFILVK